MLLIHILNLVVSMDQVKAQKINDLLERSNLDEHARNLMRAFLNSISGQPQFDKIMDLLNRFPGLFENFCKCFQLKKDFLNSGKTEGDWQDFLEKEKGILG